MQDEKRDRLIALEQLRLEVADARFKMRALSREAETISYRLTEVEAELNQQARAILDGDEE